jgi:chromatin structure-remodeling complex subunit RSC9
MFVGRPYGEVTQVDFWNLYKESFSAHTNVHPMLPAAEVIKNVTVVFPQAQAMVLPGLTPRFVIRGIDRRKAEAKTPRLQCQWDESACSVETPESPQGLYEHLLEHVSRLDGEEFECTWTSCVSRTGSKEELHRHLLTHIPPEGIPRPIQRSETFNFSSSPKDLFSRPPPSLKIAKIRYKKPKSEPTTNALTALLIIRLVYRVSSATTGAVLRADEDHFGFPGIQQEEVEVEQDATVDAEIAEGERRGRRAIAQIYPLLDQVKIGDSTLMGWILEMIDASLSGDS